MSATIDSARLVVLTQTSRRRKRTGATPRPRPWRKSNKTNFKLNDVMGGLVVSTLFLIGVIAVIPFPIAMIQQTFVSKPLVEWDRRQETVTYIMSDDGRTGSLTIQ